MDPTGKGDQPEPDEGLKQFSASRAPHTRRSPVRPVPADSLWAEVDSR